VASVEGFAAGQKVLIDTGPSAEASVIATVGTAGATTMSAATDEGATVIPVAGAIGFRDGQAITIGSGAGAETAVVARIRRFGPTSITVASPLTHAHAAGEQVAGSGITFSTALTRAHTRGSQVSDDVPTPGAPNRYAAKPD